MPALQAEKGAGAMSFGKIFECTFTGSMVGSGPTVFAVWSYVIASTKPPGLVEINPVLVSAILGASVSDVETALEVLQSPDPRSRSKDADGRRLVKVSEFLYEVPTWRHYRESRNDEERKVYMREYMRSYRQKTDVKPSVNTCKPRLAQAEAEADLFPSPACGEGGESKPPKKRERKPRERNALLDALAMHGEKSDPEKMTPSAWPKIAAALADIKASCPDVTPEEIARRAKNYQTHFDATISATAIAKHWARLDQANVKAKSEPLPRSSGMMSANAALELLKNQ